MPCSTYPSSHLQGSWSQDQLNIAVNFFFTIFHAAKIRFNQMEMGPAAATEIKLN